MFNALSKEEEQSSKPENTKIDEFKTQESATDKDPLYKIVEILAPYYKNGNRDFITFYLSGILRKQKIPLERAKTAIELLAQNDEQLDVRLNVLRDTYAKADPDEISGIWGLRDTLRILAGEEKGSQAIEQISKLMESAPTDLTDDEIINRVVEHLKSKYHFVTLEETKEMYYYSNGVYVSGAEILIEKEAQSLFPEKMRNKKVMEIIGNIKRGTYRKRIEFDPDRNIVNMKNGLYNMETGELRTHSPDYLSLRQLPYPYNPKAKPKLFGKFLKSVLDPRDIRTLIEAMAYTFHKENRYEIIVILLGNGANGKNPTIHILTKLHGGNVSNITLHDLLDNKFALADLEGKDVNIDIELSNVTINDAARLKRLTGRQPVRLERKNKDGYEVQLYAKLWFNANKLPASQDDSDGFYRRIIVISYPNQFEGKNDDSYLDEKLTTEKELSGIFNVMMSARKRIMKNGIYVNEETIQEKREKYERASNPVASFQEEMISPDSIESDEVSKEELYRAYRDYCKVYRLPSETKENFGKILVREHGFKPNQRSRVERITVWKGIRLKDSNDGATELKKELMAN